MGLIARWLPTEVTATVDQPILLTPFRRLATVEEEDDLITVSLVVARRFSLEPK